MALAGKTEEKPAPRGHRLAALPKLILSAVLLLAIVDMLAGVVLRYVVVAVTDYFDWDPVSFFWVEEVGEFALAWLTLIGAALAILEGTHFALAVLTHRLPPRIQGAIVRLNHLLIALFGALTAGFGWRLCAINSTLTSPGLQINLAWLYFSAVAGGALMALYGLGVAWGVLTARVIDAPGKFD